MMGPRKGSRFNSELRRANAVKMWAARSLETRQAVAKKISFAHKGKVLSLEHRLKLSIAHLGQAAWNRGWKENRPEVIERMRQSHLGKSLTSEQRGKIGLANRGKPCPEERRRRISAAQKGRPMSEEKKANLRVKCRGWTHSESARTKIAEKSRLAWVFHRVNMMNGPRAMMRSAGRKPNKAESLLQATLEELFPGEWVYTGGGPGAVSVNGYFPDFLHERGKKIIELDGAPWHKDRRRDRRRNAAYRRAGYLVLAIPYNGRFSFEVLRSQLREFYSA